MSTTGRREWISGPSKVTRSIACQSAQMQSPHALRAGKSRTAYGSTMGKARRHSKCSAVPCLDHESTPKYSLLTNTNEHAILLWGIQDNRGFWGAFQPQEKSIDFTCQTPGPMVIVARGDGLYFGGTPTDRPYRCAARPPGHSGGTRERWDSLTLSRNGSNRRVHPETTYPFQTFYPSARQASTPPATPK